jgi:hypothetical protein
MEEWNKKVKLIRMLNDDHETKYATFEGEIEENDGEKKSAVLVLEKTPFQLDNVVNLMKDNDHQFKVDFINDVYQKYTVAARSSCNGMFNKLCKRLTRLNNVFIRY